MPLSSITTNDSIYLMSTFVLILLSVLLSRSSESTMSTPREKLQELLRKLFQFDAAELDFGIYRIMNHKRTVIEDFIEKDLLDAVTAELASGALAQQSTLADELAETIEQIKDKLGSEALDAEGNLDPTYEKTPLGKQYLKLHAAAAGAKNRPELEAEIFNQLYTFFSRYYDEGDFMSLRRYSKREKYAIPYNGEEVFLHWANSDQYYIKTGENFTDYSYSHGNWSVRFKLRNANIEQNNVKGAKRFFVPQLTAVAVDEVRREVTVPFEFRPFTAEEEIRFGKTKIQEAIAAEAVPQIMDSARSNTDALSALAHEKRRDSDNNPVSLLDHHLRIYTKKNSTDFFIHKDLKGFLERELDFYLKNEVLNLDEVNASGEMRSERWFQLLRTIKGIGRKIIEFISQIEDFQKRLFEKKKFVTLVNYCFTLDRVPEELLPLIANNNAQVQEWKELLLINEMEPVITQPTFSEPVTVEFLKVHRNLILDTRHFDQDFKDKLLQFASMESDLDGILNGLLVHGENQQAMSLLEKRYRRIAKLSFLDPPYNTGSDGFPYKDNYQHSSWLSMLHERLLRLQSLLSADGIVAVCIDDHEVYRLGLTLNAVFGEENRAACAPWKSEASGGKEKTGLRTGHEYVLIYHNGDPSSISQMERSTGALDRTDKFGRYRKGRELRKWGGTSLRQDRPGQWYPLKSPDGTDAWPIRNDGREGHWRWGLGNPKIKKALDDFDFFHWERTPYDPGVVVDGSHDRWVPYEKIRDEKKNVGWTTWLDAFGTNADATRTLKDLFGYKPFETPKPISLFQWLTLLHADDEAIVIDPFAGSGTVGHAVIQVNREEGGDRRFLLFDMSDDFENVLLPRLKKVVYSKDWKDGKPISRLGDNYAFKYLTLESYEDALDNISFRDSKEIPLQMDDYVLSYMLDHETKESATLLNVAQLDSPFDYRLYRHGKDEPLPVDLPETFNYLIGLHVKTRKVYENKGVRYLVYRGKSDERETVVIWRTTRGWGQKQFDADRTFIAKQKIVDAAEDIFVNTDSFVPGARSLDPVFKRRMFNEE